MGGRWGKGQRPWGVGDGQWSKGMAAGQTGRLLSRGCVWLWEMSRTATWLWDVAVRRGCGWSREISRICGSGRVHGHAAVVAVMAVG